MGMHNFKKDACCQVAINLLGTQGSVLLKPSLFIHLKPFIFLQSMEKSTYALCFAARIGGLGYIPGNEMR
jgi:hypothetical protein